MFAADYEDENFTYGFYTSGNAYVKKYKGSTTETEVSIPATIPQDKDGNANTKNVTGIGAGAFEGNETVVKIHLLRNGTCTLGERAFKGCTNLKVLNYSYSGATAILKAENIVIPTSTINVSVFEGCSSIETVNFRYQVNSIGKNAFKGCCNITSFTNSYATDIGEAAFEGCTSLASVTFANVTTIGDNAFKGCTALTTPSFAKATSIGESAFEGCTSLILINANGTSPNWTTFPETVNIGNYAFKGCTRLRRVYLRGGTIGDGAFSNCDNLTATEDKDSNLPSGQVRLYEISSFGKNVFTTVPRMFIPFELLSEELLAPLGTLKSLKEKVGPIMNFDSTEGFIKVVSCKVPFYSSSNRIHQYQVKEAKVTGNNLQIAISDYSIGRVVPANTAVILKYTGTSDSFHTFSFIRETSDVSADFSDNCLQATDDKVNVNSDSHVTYFKLKSGIAKGTEVEVSSFEKIESATDIPAGSGYLAIMTLDGDENTDYADAIAAHDDERVTMNFTRGITAGKWSTICLPFDLSSSQQTSVFGAGVEVAKLTDESTESTLKFATLSDETIEANKPYAIKVASNFSTATIPNVTLSNATPSVTAGDWTFTGVYTPVNIPADSYFFSDNKLWRAADDTNTIKAFRGYFTFTNNSGAGSREMNVSVDGELTGIRTIESGVQNVENEYFDLQGRKVAQPTKGLYIVNGKKIIVK